MTPSQTPVSATAGWYRRAADELAATSELQRTWALGVSSDAALLTLIDELPREHRQPSLLFAVAAWCGAPAGAYPEWRDFVVDHWSRIGPAAAARRTQTNEVARCIPLLVGISHLTESRPGPIALLELGAAAGLCLALDRYSYRFDGGQLVGDSAPLLTCSTQNVSVVEDGPGNVERPEGEKRTPTRLPEIVWRAGVDLAPLDVRNAAHVRWLEALLPPDRPARVARLRQAIAAVRDDPPRIVAGDALSSLATLAEQARSEAPHATLVVASLGTAVYLPPADRAALPDAVADLGAHLVAFEPAAALPGIRERLAPERPARPDHAEPAPFVLSVDGRPLARAGAHADRLFWLSGFSSAGQPELPDSGP